MTNTFVATAAAALAWLIVENISKGKPSLLGAVTGAVAGLVAVTPASGFAGPMGAIVLGLVAGVVCFIAARRSRTRWATTTRSTCSASLHRRHRRRARHRHPGGACSAAPYLRLRRQRDCPYDMANQLWVQFKTVCLTLAWSGIGTLILLGLVRIVVGLRPATDQEREGLDLVDHGERAYNY
jgi:Amt family ammonium transporter